MESWSAARFFSQSTMTFSWSSEKAARSPAVTMPSRLGPRQGAFASFGIAISGGRVAHADNASGVTSDKIRIEGRVRACGCLDIGLPFRDGGSSGATRPLDLVIGIVGDGLSDSLDRAHLGGRLDVVPDAEGDGRHQDGDHSKADDVRAIRAAHHASLLLTGTPVERRTRGFV